jgi:hypothetical protein
MEESIRAIVRPTERVRVVLEARDPSVDDHRASRALVVVTRIVESGSIPAGLEQGWCAHSLFAAKHILRRHSQPPGTKGHLEVRLNRLCTI